MMVNNFNDFKNEINERLAESGKKSKASLDLIQNLIAGMVKDDLEFEAMQNEKKEMQDYLEKEFNMKRRNDTKRQREQDNPKKKKTYKELEKVDSRPDSPKKKETDKELEEADRKEKKQAYEIFLSL